MSNQFAATIIAFKGEKEYLTGTTLIECTDITASGTVEIAFNLPKDGNRRVYLELDLSELLKRAITKD
jgi:hypothetical protein